MTNKNSIVLQYGWLIICLSAVFIVPCSNKAVVAGVHFGQVGAVEEKVDDVDSKLKQPSFGNNENGSDQKRGCLVKYPDWLKSVDNQDNLEAEILDYDTSTSSALDVINNSDFNDTDLTTDTMVQRCNTSFVDSDTPSYRHRIFCRAFRLPDGKKYDNFTQLQNDVNQAPSDLVTVSFFHGGNIDDGSESWIIPFLNQYQNNCHNRPTHVIWFGAFVKKNGDRQITEGNKWHITSTDWGPSNPTILYDVMTNSDLVVTGHSTASCPFDGSDTRGLYVGGKAEAQGRDVDSRIGSNSLWVGSNSNNSGQCFSGVASDNPANASGGGIQLEYQVTTPTPVPPEDIAEAILREY